MSRGTTSRNIRIDKVLWDAALEQARREGIDVSAKVRSLLRDWVASPAEPERP